MTSDPDEPDDESPNDGDIPEDEERSEEEIESSTDPFGSLANIRAAISSLPTIEIQNLVAPEVLRAIRDPIGPELRRALTQPVIDPELIQQLQQPAIDPELVRALQEPTIDPEVIDAMQQPPIDEATLQALSEPAIDPELIRSLESLNNSALLQAYEAAAAIEQIDEKSIEEIDEEDIEENVEEPEQGGFLSTFFNITAFYLLQQSEDLPEESVRHLSQILQAESVQTKTDAFHNFVDSAKGAVSNLIMAAGLFAFHATWGLYFADEIESVDEETDDDDEEKEDEEEEDDD
jgi:hypothetical protein